MVQKERERSNLRKIILEFPKQFREGIKRGEHLKIKEGFDYVIICGMGGSALPAEILKIWLKKYKIALPLIINRSYQLPEGDEHSLYVCISYSGNTEEVLHNYREIIRKKLPVVVITSDGKLAELAKYHRTPLVIVPKGVPPRLALGYQFSALMKILVKAGMIQNGLLSLLRLEKTLKPKTLEKKGEEIAKRLKGKLPIIYSSDFWEPLARIWKINFCENSKVLSFHNYFPELSHNEIAGFWHLDQRLSIASKIHLLVLQEKKEHPRILKQMRFVKSLLEREGIEIEFVKIEGKTILEKIFSNITLSYWTSYHLACLYQVDPIAITMIEELKLRLKKNS